MSKQEKVVFTSADGEALEFYVVEQTRINNVEDVKTLAEELYPQIISSLGDNQYIGVRIELGKTIKSIFSQGETLRSFQRSLLRQ